MEFVQQLKSIDHSKRFQFTNWPEDRLAGDNEAYRKKISSDEKTRRLCKQVKFSRRWYVKFECCRQITMHPQRFGYGVIICPFFLESNEDAIVIVSGKRYRAMLTDLFFAATEAVFS